MHYVYVYVCGFVRGCPSLRFLPAHTRVDVLLRTGYSYHKVLEELCFLHHAETHALYRQCAHLTPFVYSNSKVAQIVIAPVP